MEAKHTAGPWQRNIRPATKYPTVFAGRNTHVAHVVTNRLSAEEVEANLALIVAAPEMFALLQEAIESPSEFETEWNKAARAAIKKATGEGT